MPGIDLTEILQARVGQARWGEISEKLKACAGQVGDGRAPGSDSSKGDIRKGILDVLALTRN